MNVTTSQTDESLAARLGYFLLLVFRLTPSLLWWLLATLVFSIVNDVFRSEFWPNTPKAGGFFWKIILACLCILPWLSDYLAWRIVKVVKDPFWNMMWRFVAVAGSLLAMLISALALVGFIILFLQS